MSLNVDNFDVQSHTVSMTLTWHAVIQSLTVLMTLTILTTCLCQCVLMTLTYNTLLYNDSQPIHDLTSWRLTTQRLLDFTWKHPLHVSDSCWWFDIWHSLRVDDTMSGYAQRVALQWLTAHPWLNVLASHCSPVTWLDIQTPTAYVLITHDDDLTSDIHCVLWLDVRSLTMCWWLWRMTPCSTMTHSPSMTWHLDVSLLNDDLTWHWNTHCVLVTYVDDLTSGHSLCVED